MLTRILIVDDDESICDLLELRLSRAGFDVRVEHSFAGAREAVGRATFDVVVADVRMPGAAGGGVELCAWLGKERPDLPVILMTAFGDMGAALNALRAGAYDLLSKPFETSVLERTVERAIERRRLLFEVQQLRRAAAKPASALDVLGGSPAMTRVRELIEAVAGLEVSVLITGDSGTGKELCARTIHQQSARRKGPFIGVNCAALPATLLESELMGHVRGAFTDAREKKGMLLQAEGGTLLLDEIGEMPMELQPKLLRVLQERTVRPLGGDRDVPFDARIVAATNSDLEAMVRDKRFRQDLYYRLNVIRVQLPSLHERGDAVTLAQQMLLRIGIAMGKHVTGLTATASRALEAYTWPGNVRELSNCMERAVALARQEEIGVDDLPESIRRTAPETAPAPTAETAELISLEEMERRHILSVLAAMDGNRTRAAEVLGLHRRTLYRKLELYGIV
jgi:two-component system response regulator HydG